MGHTYTNLHYHIIFGTKNREPIIGDELLTRLLPYIGGIIRELYGSATIVNGTADHVHILASSPASVAIAEIMRVVKSNSSRWINELGIVRGRFEWQSGYGAFSVSHSNVETVKRYIADQAEHHRRMTFAEEFVLFLKKHGVEYDERYLWK
ncbi:MAG: IS200/IS605 family transposase [candidate division Zixibacteria bacterium]|nr:IS200/IS605 family transposase [candidate division Zixibacteria bacterium]